MAKKKALKGKKVKAAKKVKPLGVISAVEQKHISDRRVANTQKMSMITSILKDRMLPRELNDAVREIKSVLES